MTRLTTDVDALNEMFTAGVIAIFTQRLLNGDPIRIDWDGEQAKDYVYVEDVAHASVLALTRGDGGVYCLGTGRGTPVNELHRWLVRLVGHETPIVHAPKRPGDVHLAYFDCSRARADLDWAPAVPLEEGMRRTVAYFRAQHAQQKQDEQHHTLPAALAPIVAATEPAPISQ